MAIGRISGQMLKANLLRSGVDLAFETNLLVLDVTNSFVGIGTTTPARQLHLSGTGALRLPSGSNAQRGASANGDIRYNSEQGVIEGYSNDEWKDLTDIGIDSIEDDLNPRLGGDLDVQARSITTSVTNGNVTISPNGTGSVVMSKVDINGGDIDGTTIGASSAAAGTFTDITGTNLSVGDADVDTVSADNGTDFDLVLADNQAAALEIKEGSNAYMTFVTTNSSEQITVDKKLVVSNGVTFQSNTVDINGGNIDGTDIGTAVRAAGNFTTVDTSGNVTVGGNLTVNGTTTTIESTTLTIEDPLIILAKNNSGGAGNTFDQGLLFNRGSFSNVSFIWDESADEFVVANTAGETGTTAGNVTIDSYAKFHAGATTVSDLTANGIIDIDGDGSGDNIDGVIIGANLAAAGTFTTINGTSLETSGVVTANGGLTTGRIELVQNEIRALTSNDDLVLSGSGTGAVRIESVDINGGNIDGTVIGGSVREQGLFTFIGSTEGIDIQANNQQLRIGLDAEFTVEHDGTNTQITNNEGILKIDGASTSSIRINEAGADVDVVIEGDSDTNLFFVDASANKIGIGTATPEYVIDAGSTTGAIRIPNGTTAERTTASAGVIRFNSTLGVYEGSVDGSTWTSFAMGGAQVAINKVSTTGDGSTSTFTGFFSATPASANNVMVYIDNVYQEPTENYTVSSNNITFTSAPHSGARIFAIEGFDNTAVQTGGVARSLTESVSFTSAATTIMDFNATEYRSAELYIQITDAANTEYSCMKAHVIHNGATAFINTYGIVNTGGSDTATLSATYSAGTVSVQAISTGGQSSAIVQYSLAAV
jgi:hypothetical protein